MVSYTSWPTSTHPEGHVNLSLRYLKLRDFETIHRLLEANKITEEAVKVDAKEGAVLLTGATGFLGSHILEELLVNTESKVYCLVRKIKNSDKTSEDRLKEKVNNETI